MISKILLRGRSENNIFLKKGKKKKFENYKQDNKRINSVNLNKKIENKKALYYSQYKDNRRNISSNFKMQLSAIKRTSYKDLFNSHENESTGEKNIQQKLFLLNNNEDKAINNIKLKCYNSSKNSHSNNISVKRSNLFMIYKNNNNRNCLNLLKSKFTIKNENLLNHNRYKKITPSNSCKNYFKNKTICDSIMTSKNIERFNERIFFKKEKHFNSTERLHNTSNYCDASTNTIIQVKKNRNNSNKNKRPLMIDYLYNEHKQFCYGFDKLKGKNKIKKPYFIVYKY